MSKFCYNCGSQLDDSATICLSCGVALNNEPAQPQTMSTIKSFLSEPNNKKLAIAISSIVLVVIITLLSVLISVNSYKPFVKKLIGAFEEQDMQTIYSCVSEVYYTGEYSFSEAKDEIDEVVWGSFVDIKDDVGYIKEINCKKIECRKIDDTLYYSMMENLEWHYGKIYDFKKYKKAKAVNLKLEAIGINGNRNTYYVHNLIIIKENGKWKALFYPSAY